MDKVSSATANLLEIQFKLHDWLLLYGLESDDSVALTSLISVLAMLILAMALDRFIHLLLRKLIPHIFNRIPDKERAKSWVTALRKHTLAQSSAHIIAALLVYFLTPLILRTYPSWVNFIRNIIEGYLVFICIYVLNALIKAAVDVYRQSGWSARLPLQFISQTTQTVLWLIGGILFISVLFDQPVGVLLTGLAGMTAILALVFRDTLLGWVAGIQIVNNDLIREGDWIESAKYGANGAVIDIGLITIKVRNWDKTLTSIPSYSLIGDGFKNWRGMYDSGGRRIKRSIPIDMRSIQFCSEEMLERFRHIELLHDFIVHKQQDMKAGDRQHKLDKGVAATNGRRLTNIGIYRDYLLRYLQQHADISNQMTLMVRQLPPGPAGVTIEIYAFSTNQNWTEYEAIQAEIIDHALAVLPTFGLNAYQYPTSDAMKLPII